MTTPTKPKRRIRDPRLDPRPGDVVRNRAHFPEYRTVNQVLGAEVEYQFANGKYTRVTRLVDWRAFGHGAEIVKRAKVTR